jgi:hypothetical protein
MTKQDKKDILTEITRLEELNNHILETIKFAEGDNVHKYVKENEDKLVSLYALLEQTNDTH